MKKLIAKRPILYLGRTYKRGDILPAHDQRMVTAWLLAGSAAWSGQDTPASRGPSRKKGQEKQPEQDPAS